ncbi:hypothetical protein L916_17092 [Phytophthora nicotianae]|uniref:Uncharacterized protein n=1 Tax=Phytophthora nicotianae TaxID=4792 RepID=W2I8V1_PHYNI|nr:hypothetical protein L916_17092 [Phytophthora nicotianae]
MASGGSHSAETNSVTSTTKESKARMWTHYAVFG